MLQPIEPIPNRPVRPMAEGSLTRHQGLFLALVVGLLSALMCLPSMAWAAKVGITDLRTWSAPDNTRLVLDLTGAPTYRVRRESNPPRLVIEIKGGQPRTGQSDWKRVDKRVSGVHLEGTKKGTRVTVDLARSSPFKHFTLSPYGNKPHRIVVDVLSPKKETIAAAKPKKVRAAALRAVALRTAALGAVAPPKQGRKGALAAPFVVVIDAGHGGEDPGALGRYYKTREKDVVLKIARYVRAELAKMPGITPHLTRDGDYFISLGRRVAKANRWRGDLFVSIHADSSRNRHTRGTHVYTLAPRTAQDRRAVRVAHAENASDLVGGVRAASRLPMIFDRNGAPNNIVESRVLSHLALDRLEDVNNRGRKGRRSEARFWVLKGNRPSILVETGFLSNKKDEKSLRSDKFQRQLAKRIALAVKDYYDSRVTPTTFMYAVRRGDNLTHIAKRYGVSVADIKRANRLRNASKLKVGTRLVIPVRGPLPGRVAAKASVKKVSFSQPAPLAASAWSPSTSIKSRASGQRHKVRRGENPTRIAKRYGVRLADLLSANHLTNRSKLAVGQSLVIPPARAGDQVHVVRRGDTLSGLAKRYGISLSKLALMNDLGTRTKLRRGQRLIVPGGSVASVSGPHRHVVRSGETLSGLSQRFGVSLSSLARANGMSTRARLLKGQRLNIPAGKELVPTLHVVRSGETLSGLSQRFGVSLSSLARANGISTRTRLQKGQRLKLPIGSRASKASKVSVASAPRHHRIKYGDSLSRIASRYDVTVASLKKHNAITNADHLTIGRRLLIPD